MMDKSRKIEMEIAKNGLLNLVVDGIHYYSRYNPLRDVAVFLEKYINAAADRYVIFGLGLGYHVEKLLDVDPKPILIVEIDSILIEETKNIESLKRILNNPFVELITELSLLNLKENDQIIVLPTWQKTLQNNQLKELFQEMIWAKASERSQSILEDNFKHNVKKSFRDIKNLYNFLDNKSAILVAAGPSLNENIEFLKKSKGNIFILAVGAAYPVLIKEGILPDSVIVTDPNPIVFEQLKNQNLSVPLFALCTVYPEILNVQAPISYMLFQKDFPLAEEYIGDSQLLLETGGSVATTAFSLLLYMGVKRLIFVGQDLAYGKFQSHALNSTSNKQFDTPIITPVTTISNNGELVPTSLSWNHFRKFFEERINKHPDIEFINTSYNGAYIKGTKYMKSEDISINPSEIDYSQKMINL